VSRSTEELSIQPCHISHIPAFATLNISKKQELKQSTACFFPTRILTTHHSKMQKDGWAKYIPNFAFK
jgi:hypothetical protein